MQRIPSAPVRLERVLWRRGVLNVAGVDEAGRGCLAGPVVAAAVIWKDGIPDVGIRESKLLTPERREDLFAHIRKEASAIAVGVCSHEEIDRVNILNATLQAMSRAVAGLPLQPDFCLVDGLQVPVGLTMPVRAIVRGDLRSRAIAAASIVAKVTRDHMMDELDREWPQYGWIRNKGYATRDHIDALARYGPCHYHRRTFQVRGLSKP